MLLWKRAFSTRGDGLGARTGHCARSRGQFTNHRAQPGCTWDGGALSPPVPSSGRPCSSQPELGPLPVWGPAAPSPSPSHPRLAHTCPRVTSGAEEAAAGTHQPQGSSLAVHAWAPMSGGGSPTAPKVIPSCSAGRQAVYGVEEHDRSAPCLWAAAM